ncbi:hypothetical protein GCM10029976_041530 [Kribbella albertanoniae]|uniref:Uncharacterized protein n=1 Tax=Kribbella albertanoniae TaxID=1266829 RepID=A0A4R4QB38_9ACTN|nr:hypothetical protein [Kribbella albertanoniae]TDC32500.1 hypothetical protein E1261_08410 [Kribbella albertanoniae]
MRFFSRPADPTEAVLRRLSKRLRWFRPSLADAPTPSEQLTHLAQHRLCPAIDRGDTAPLITALTITEDALTESPDDELDSALIHLVELISNWVSWPETPPSVLEAIESSMGPETHNRWNRIRRQSTTVAGWLGAGSAPEREAPADYREVQDAVLRFLVRSNMQYVDETLTISTTDRLRHELATGQGM